MWDPELYERFTDERARPFTDLLSRVDVPGARRIVDLGCGTGSLTARLAARWPGASVLGVDSSPEMLAAASRRSLPGHLDFRQLDLRDFEPDEPFDLIVSNAALQWVPGHLSLLGRLAGLLSPGGVLALQVPANFNEPSHRLLAELCVSPRWRDTLGPALAARPGVGEPGDYLAALLDAGLTATVWETTYVQVLPGDHAVLEWMRGTALRPALAVLGDGAGAVAFLSEYGAALDDAYPPGPHGTVLPYRRIFAVGRAGGGGSGSRRGGRGGGGGGAAAGGGTAAGGGGGGGAAADGGAAAGGGGGAGAGAVGRVGVEAGAGAVAGAALAGPVGVTRLDHVQLAMPAGQEAAARRFYGGVLGLTEQPKPPVLAARGGCWFTGQGAAVHLGVDPDFRPARKAHVALEAADLDALAARLEAAGTPVAWDEELAPRRRCTTDDPFGNRIELLGPA